MKWENHDTNVVELANISKFSKLNKREREAERDRERQRETETERERQSETETGRETERQRQRKTERHRERQRDRESCAVIERNQTYTSFKNPNETFRSFLRMLYLVGAMSLKAIKCIGRRPQYFCTSNVWFNTSWYIWAYSKSASMWQWTTWWTTL